LSKVNLEQQSQQFHKRRLLLATMTIVSLAMVLRLLTVELSTTSSSTDLTPIVL
jgi:hypothetical protein